MLNRRVLLVSTGAAAVLAVAPVSGLPLIGEAVPPEVIAFGPEWATLWLNASPSTRDVARGFIEKLARMSDEQLVRFAELPPGEWAPGYAARSSACSGVM